MVAAAGKVVVVGVVWEKGRREEMRETRNEEKKLSVRFLNGYYGGEIYPERGTFQLKAI